MKKDFANELLKIMQEDKDVYLLTGDLGFGALNTIEVAFPDRYINCGASEQAMMGIACGLALEGKIPFVYSISTFLLNRPFEWIRNYIDHEKIPVKLVGVGRDQEYEHDGFSHFATDTKKIMSLFENILQYWPESSDEVKEDLRKIHTNGLPSFISLRR